MFLRRSIAHNMPGWQKLLHYVGLLAALTIAVLPLFRSILITLALIAMLELFKTKKTTVRITVVTVMILSAVGLILFKTMAPDMFGYRVSDPSDIYARIAQQKQSLEMFAANPLNGVGWNGYMDAATNFSDVTYKGVYSVGSAHNTLGALLAETGILGFIPFIVAQVFLLRFFWHLRRRGTHDAILASDFCTYTYLAYWITGVSLTSGYFSDINMWFLFVIGVCCKFALTEPPPLQASHFSHHRTISFPENSRAVSVART
jgi:O-antigen ligase